MTEFKDSGSELTRIDRKKWPLIVVLSFPGLVLIFTVFSLGVLYSYIKPRYQLAERFDLAELDRRIPGRAFVRLDDVSSHFVDALIAAEDPRFYQHRGIDYQGLGKAIYLNAKDPKQINEGADSLTQKLIRLNFAEKLKARPPNPALEICLAHRVETYLEKEQILELYINQIDFGSGYVGITAASEGFFGKSPKALNLSESATLVGVIRNPFYRCPRHYPEACKTMRDYVLNLMAVRGVIDQGTAANALKSPIEVRAESAEPE